MARVSLNFTASQLDSRALRYYLRYLLNPFGKYCISPIWRDSLQASHAESPVSTPVPGVLYSFTVHCCETVVRIPRTTTVSHPSAMPRLALTHSQCGRVREVAPLPLPVKAPCSCLTSWCVGRPGCICCSWIGNCELFGAGPAVSHAPCRLHGTADLAWRSWSPSQAAAHWAPVL